MRTVVASQFDDPVDQQRIACATVAGVLLPELRQSVDDDQGRPYGFRVVTDPLELSARVPGVDTFSKSELGWPSFAT